jgi:hypothetical protein
LASLTINCCSEVSLRLPEALISEGEGKNV